MQKTVLAVLAMVLAAWAATAAGEKPARPPALEVVSRFALAEKPGQAFVDLRWAGKDSIYLAELHAGVSEVKLAEGLPEVRRLTPSTAQIGVGAIRHVAISDKWIVAAHTGRMAWKAVDGDWHVQSDIGFFHEFDIRGDEIVMLGSPDAENYERSQGGVVWRADLSKGLSRWDFLYESAAVAQDFMVMNQHAALGSIRFLPGGEIVVAPNFLPDVLLFSPSGSLKRRWTKEDLWGGGSPGKGLADEREEGWRGLKFEREELRRYLAAGRTIDEILPLPEGPAIVVREPRGDAARYRLGILGSEIRWYDIPIGDVSPLARLRGDADERGRIVLAAVERGPTARVASSEILVLRLPR